MSELVYVVSKNGKPLMPTDRFGKVRRMIRDGKAIVLQPEPFTIQLTYQTETEITQPIVLGVDAGSKVVGMSATTEKKELYASETQLRTDIVKLLATRKQNRGGRRGRKTRYRKMRVKNRANARQEGRLMPSVRHRIDTHLKLIDAVCKILPVSHIIIETASFDIQKLKNPDIQGVEYQQGEQLDSWNVREYVLFRDGHICQHCKGESKDKILNTHHIESRKTGGDSPGNQITVCETCHDKHNRGEITFEFVRGKSFRAETFMGIMRWTLYNELKEKYDNVSNTYGYITKNTRISNNLEKTHCTDAFCITGNINAERLPYYYQQKAVRKRNRQLHKSKIYSANDKKNLSPGEALHTKDDKVHGYRKANKSPQYVKGFQLFDKVMFEDRVCFIFGRRSSGSFDIRMLDGTRIHAGISSKMLKLLERAKTILTERRMAVPPASEGTGLPA
jgi:hypothetical protein